ncbi:MAG: polyprenyl diphosphate synthase [bacterium]
MSNLHIPVHIGAIMDGNGRWARRRGLPRTFGHRQGVKALREIVETCGEIGVRFLTVFTFSTENWQRPPKEVKNLINLISRAIDEQSAEMIKNNVRFRTIGRLHDFPRTIQKKVISLIADTKENTGLTFTLALSYGGRAEIIDACRRIWDLGRKKVISTPPTSEDQFRNFLYDPELPDIDILIRTGGEKRISNFLLWHLAYAELYFTETLWPDFRRQQLLEAIEEFSRRERRFGCVKEE